MEDVSDLYLVDAVVKRVGAGLAHKSLMGAQEVHHDVLGDGVEGEGVLWLRVDLRAVTGRSQAASSLPSLPLGASLSVGGLCDLGVGLFRFWIGAQFRALTGVVGGGGA